MCAEAVPASRAKTAAVARALVGRPVIQLPTVLLLFDALGLVVLREYNSYERPVCTLCTMFLYSSVCTSKVEECVIQLAHGTGD